MASAELAMVATYIYATLFAPLIRRLPRTVSSQPRWPIIIEYIPSKTIPISDGILDHTATTTASLRDATAPADFFWPSFFVLLIALLALGAMALRHRSPVQQRTSLVVALTAALTKNTALRDARRRRSQLRCARRKSQRKFVFARLSQRLIAASSKIAKLESELDGQLQDLLNDFGFEIMDLQQDPTSQQKLAGRNQLKAAQTQLVAERLLRHRDAEEFVQQTAERQEKHDKELASLQKTHNKELADLQEQHDKNLRKALREKAIRGGKDRRNPLEKRISQLDSLKGNYGLHYAEIISELYVPGKDLPNSPPSVPREPYQPKNDSSTNPDFVPGGCRVELFENIDDLLEEREMSKGGLPSHEEVQAVFSTPSTGVPTVRLPPASSRVVSPAETDPVPCAQRFNADGTRLRDNSVAVKPTPAIAPTAPSAAPTTTSTGIDGGEAQKPYKRKPHGGHNRRKPNRTAEEDDASDDGSQDAGPSRTVSGPIEQIKRSPVSTKAIDGLEASIFNPANNPGVVPASHMAQGPIQPLGRNSVGSTAPNGRGIPSRIPTGNLPPNTPTGPRAARDQGLNPGAINFNPTGGFGGPGPFGRSPYH